MNRFKSLLNGWLRPFARRFVYRRLDQRIDHRVRMVMANQYGEVTNHLPVLLNLATSFATAQRDARHMQVALWNRVGDLEKRLEFVRREIMFEMRRQNGTVAISQDTAPRIVNQAKLEAAGDDIRLNLGCGHIPIDSFINVDARELEGVDIVAEVHALPFESDSVARIHSAHLLEHFPPDDLNRSLLPYWFSLLRPGGEFSAVVPDAETMLAEYAASRLPFKELREVTYGGQEYEGNFHFNMFSKESLCGALREVGFVDVTVSVAGRRNGLCYEMEINARKPATASDRSDALERTDAR